VWGAGLRVEGLPCGETPTRASVSLSRSTVVPACRIHINVQRFRGGLVFKAHRLCVSLNYRLEINKEEEDG